MLEDILIFTGLPGSGKSSKIIEMLNEQRNNKKDCLFILSNENDILTKRPKVKNFEFGCRKPNLSTKIDYIVSTNDLDTLLNKFKNNLDIYIDEAQYFTDQLVNICKKQITLGKKFIISCPSFEQLEKFKTLKNNNDLNIKIKNFELNCLNCRDEIATKYYIDKYGDFTVALCNKCFGEYINISNQITETLIKIAPRPNEKVIYQPVPIEGTFNFECIREDSINRLKIMKDTISKYYQKDMYENLSYVDVGCNTGFFVNYISLLKIKSVGVDVVKNDLDLGRLIAKHLTRSNSQFINCDALEYLSNLSEQFDITSSFSVFQWIMLQKNYEAGLKCIELLFKKTKKICFFELGYKNEEHYRDRIKEEINQDWIYKVMHSSDQFKKIEFFDANKNKLKRDFFVGIK